MLAFEGEVVRVICGYGLQSGRGIAEKGQFFDGMANEWDLHKVDELVLGMGDFNGHVGKWIQGFEGVHGGNGIGERNLEGRMLLEFRDERVVCGEHVV
uniref:Endonuclease/exonuclease/phosphatase domain-containing protein n=1 Tax=Octopus bimaculoides TaxID=37653 RepID=A0A0L8FZ88_OCTBM